MTIDERRKVSPGPGDYNLNYFDLSKSQPVLPIFKSEGVIKARNPLKQGRGPHVGPGSYDIPSIFGVKKPGGFSRDDPSRRSGVHIKSASSSLGNLTYESTRKAAFMNKYPNETNEDQEPKSNPKSTTFGASEKGLDYLIRNNFPGPGEYDTRLALKLFRDSSLVNIENQPERVLAKPISRLRLIRNMYRKGVCYECPKRICGGVEKDEEGDRGDERAPEERCVRRTQTL